MKPLLVLKAMVLAATLFCSQVQAQTVLFDFDSAPLHSPLPIDQTVNGITAHFGSEFSYYNYSIQRPSDAIYFTPPGFSGFCIFPSTVFRSDLLISFGTAHLTAISLMYSPEEYATDSSCTMRITAYLGTTYVGTNTFTIDPPGTWPVGTLSFSSTQPFDNVVVHYDAAPRTGGDYGPIFMVDNVAVTPVLVPTLTSVVSRMMHGGVTPLDVDLPLPPSPTSRAVECRNSYPNGDYTLVFTFSNDLVSVGGATVSTGIGSVTAGAIGPNLNQYTVGLAGVSNAQYIAITVTNVVDAAGGSGDVVSPELGILIGDTTANGLVNSSDIAQTQSQSGQPLTASNLREDVTCNGQINSSDIALVQSRSGTGLPAPPAVLKSRSDKFLPPANSRKFHH